MTLQNTAKIFLTWFIQDLDVKSYRASIIMKYFSVYASINFKQFIKRKVRSNNLELK